MGVVPGSYWIVSGSEGIDEFRTSRDIGDSQHQPNYVVALRCFDNNVTAGVSGGTFKVRLRIDGSERIKGSKEHLKFKGVALLTSGLVKVRGEIHFGFDNGVRGQLDTVALKRCLKCNVERRTERKRCDDCGQQFETVKVYTLI